MNISKQIDKKPNADLKKFSEALKERRIELGLSLTEADKLITGGTTMYSFLEGRKDNDVYPPNKEYWEKIKEHFGMDEWSSIVENNLKIVGEKKGSFGYQKDGERWEETRKLTETTTDLAKQWEGWGTALKPAHEPIVMARKPLSENTVADNVIEWGTGGLNIDESRIENTDTLDRFPANVIFDAEAGKLLDGQCDGVSRFFYCPKTSKKDRNEGNIHPTVKPTDLMLYLIRLVTPKGGTTLDPFMGSGSTGKAAVRGGFDFVGIERDTEYMEIAESRIKYEISNPHKEENDKKVEVVDKLNQFFV